jgi:hypothetical protein
MAKSKLPKPKKYVKGIGLDIGTMNLVSARSGDQKVSTRRVRDLFLDLPRDARKRLRLSKTGFLERDNDLLILGDEALEMANVFGREPRRPLSGGLISPQEIDSLEVLGLLTKTVLGDPLEDGEVCYFSIPSDPIDMPGRDTVYHEGVFNRIITECGYTPFSSTEAMGVLFSECARDGFSGVALSYGAGMTNVALAVNAMEVLTFSVARGGDWIDQGAAKAVNSTEARMCALKEKGVDLANPKSREDEAIVFYTQEVIRYSLKMITEQFDRIRNQVQLMRPLPIVVSGGTSLAKGFLDLFEGVLEGLTDFPVEVSEVRHAKEPLTSVARGMLVQARQEYDEDEDEGD